MKIGLLQVSLHAPMVGSLKEKRNHVQSLKKQIQNKFNVSVAEVDSQDLHQRIDLAAVMVSTDGSLIDQVFSEIMKLISRQAELEILEEFRQML
jgi:uncharacterized protein